MSIIHDSIMAIFHTEPECTSATRQSLTGTRWHFAPPVEQLPAGIHPALGQVLISRGIISPQEVASFRDADLSALADPFLMADMLAAVAALQDALQRGIPMRVFGDYDVDGITATAMLVRALSALGGKIDWYVPHRIEDGYGLNKMALQQAKDDGVELGITVDNGISAHESLAYAATLGIRMIVTDHHEPEETLPTSLAVLNPKRRDCTYPYRELAGVGVAFTLLRALCLQRGIAVTAVARFLDLVTLGTVADVAPLTGENRILVRHGLPQLTLTNKKVGVVAILKAIGVQFQASCSDIGYQIAPRLNAAGRIGHASDALRLILTNDASEAEQLAAHLCTQNTHRQEEEVQTLDEALLMVAERDLDKEKVLVLASPRWHPGVIGIVASRLLERFYRPTALIAVQDGIGKGSARARAPFHLWEALNEVSPLLVRFGGHRVAAGFEIAETQIPALQQALCTIGDRVLSADDMVPTLDIEAWIDLSDITTTLAREVETLAPFGMGNTMPIFATTDALVQQCCQRGQDHSHLSLSLRSGPGARTISAIWFRHGALAAQVSPGDRVDVAFTIGVNCWQGITSAQLIVKDVKK